MNSQSLEDVLAEGFLGDGGEQQTQTEWGSKSKIYGRTYLPIRLFIRGKRRHWTTTSQPAKCFLSCFLWAACPCTHIVIGTNVPCCTRKDNMVTVSFLGAGVLVSSNGLPKRMHSRIGCICLAFLHCVSSNVSSNGLHERMHSRIGCICLAFHHCVSSNEPSKNLGQSRQSHIDYICLAFPQCAS